MNPFLFIHIGLDPVAFHLGPWAVHWYGIAYVVAIVVGLRAALAYAPSRGIDEDTVWRVATWAVPAGFIGGRLFFVVQNDFGSYLANPERILQVWNGGMAYFGAILAVPVILVAFALFQRVSLAAMLDIAALFALVAQPFGRLGNIVNGDILGPVTHLPWGFVYTNPNSFAPSNTAAYQPAAIYEILANLVLIGVLFPLRKKLPRGMFAAAYVAGYCVSQLVVFTWRTEPIVLWGLRQAQVTALVLLVVVAVATAGYTWYRRRLAPAGTPEPLPAAPSAEREPALRGR